MSDDPVKVRIGTPADFDQMMDFLRVMHAENGMAPLDEDMLVPVVQCALARHRSVVGIIDEDERIAASVGLFVASWWYSRECHLQDNWNFVRPECRRSRMAKSLLEFSKEASRSLGLPLLMGVLSEERTEAKVRLYQRQLPFVGALFLYKPEAAVAHV